MFKAFSYLKQHNNGNEIDNYKDFYRRFSNEREFGGGTFSHFDHLVKNRFMNIYGHLSNVVLRKNPLNILDIGCGAGVNLPLANQYPDVKYFGIDYAEKALEHSKNIYKNIDFQVMDAFDLTFEDDCFDMVIISSVLILYSDIQDRLRILKNASRVLKKDGGVLVAIMWNEAPLLKASVRLSRVLARLKNIILPNDFMAVYLNDAECSDMFDSAGFNVKEKILAGSYYGALEAAQYLSMGKYRRKFGVEEKQHGLSKKQNILEDLKESSGANIVIIGLLYLLAKYFPSSISMYSVYVLESKK